MRDERGSGTMLVVLVAALLVIMASGVALVGTYVVRNHQARAGADLVALSAASDHRRGSDGCLRAEDSAQQNGVRLVDCVITGDQTEFVVAVEVEVAVQVTVPGLPRVLRAKAYAGDIIAEPRD